MILIRLDSPDDRYTVVLDDDDRVAYAYLRERDVIIGDVWLYNQSQAPLNAEWSDPENAPFLNPVEFADENSLGPVVDENDVRVIWSTGSEDFEAVIQIYGLDWAVLKSGSKPGWCRLAKKSGPLAKRLEMTPVQKALEKISKQLTGREISADEHLQLIRGLPPACLSKWLFDLMRRHRLASTNFLISEDLDPTGLGVAMQWMTPSDILTEALKTYPGIPASALGYLPIGTCLEGSGDPYFLRTRKDENPALVRVPHEAVDEESSLVESSVEVVSDSISDFLTRSTIE